MKANEFVKNHGLEYAKGIVVACESGFLPKNQNYEKLKRLVESYELIEQYSGLFEAKELIRVSPKMTSELRELAAAIADVESCQ